MRIVSDLGSVAGVIVLLSLGCSQAAKDYDFDGDGVDDADDCEPENSSVYPGADDPYGDGEDTDCDLCDNGAGDGVDTDCDFYPANDELVNDPVYECEGYRLPTEAEFEFAARSEGVMTDAFPSGGNLLKGDQYNCNGNLMLDDGSVLDDQAWYCGSSKGGARPVGTRPANPSGLFDTSGNVWEWCHDRYSILVGDESDPWGPTTGPNRIFRGGSWDDSPGRARAASRNTELPSSRWDELGFRLVRSLP